MEAIEKSLGREELRNLVPEMFSIVIVTLNLGSSLIMSFLFPELFRLMAMMSLQVVAAEDLRPRRVGTITHLRTQHLCNLEHLFLVMGIVMIS